MDMSYVFSGAYTPLLCKIIEQVTNSGFIGFFITVIIISMVSLRNAESFFLN